MRRLPWPILLLCLIACGGTDRLGPATDGPGGAPAGGQGGPGKMGGAGGGAAGAPGGSGGASHTGGEELADAASSGGTGGTAARLDGAAAAPDAGAMASTTDGSAVAPAVAGWETCGPETFKPNVAAAEFCARYEMVCMFDAAGGAGGKARYRSLADCTSKYSALSDGPRGGKACVAYHLCVAGFPDTRDTFCPNAPAASAMSGPCKTSYL